MRLLVTGLSGFTGQHLAPMATAAGWEVVGLQSDLSDASAVTHEVASVQPDAVVHLAGISFAAHENHAEIYRINTVGTTTLLDALVKASKPLTKVIVASSATVYGNSDVVPIPESQPPAPVNHYGASKLAMEHLARTYLDRLPVVMVRPFNYTGPGQSTQFVVPKLIEHFAQRKPTISLGNLHVKREFNDVRMVCQTYLKLMEVAEPGQTYNVCTGRAHALTEMLDVLQEMTGFCPQVVVDPAFVRQNELHALYGDPRHLQNTMGTLPSFTLSDTLQWMMDQYPQQDGQA